MVLDAVFGSGGGLIDVDSLDRASVAIIIARRTTDGVVKDENAGGSGSISVLGDPTWRSRTPLTHPSRAALSRRSNRV